MRKFTGFLAVMGLRPSAKDTLDRWPDNNGNYEPGNVRWAKKTDQDRNRRSNRIIEFRGRSQSLAAWAEEIGIDQDTLSKRFSYGWTLAEAMTGEMSPPGPGKLTAANAVEIYQSSESARDLAARFGITASTVHRIRNGQRWASATNHQPA